MNGSRKISRSQPAFAAPERSLRWKMSANTPMNTQIAMNQKKNTTMLHSTSPNSNSAIIGPPSVAAQQLLSVSTPSGRDAPPDATGGRLVPPAGLEPALPAPEAG